MRVYSTLARNMMLNNQSMVGYFQAVLLTRMPSEISDGAPQGVTALLADLGYTELADSHYILPTERPVVQTTQSTSGSVKNLLLGGALVLPADVPPTYIAGIAFVWRGTDAAGTGPVLGGVTNPWMMITDETFGTIVYPGSSLSTVSQTPSILWSWTSRTNDVDITSTGLLRSPGTVPWEPPRTQHVYLYPQRVNHVPNPSFEDVGLFGWRAKGALSRVQGGVDNANNFFGRVAGSDTRLESIPALLTSRFACVSAYVRSIPTSSVRLNGTAGTYIDGPDIAAIAGATEFTVELDVAMDTWTQPATAQLVGQVSISGTNQSWRLHLTTTGQQGFQTSSTGSGMLGYGSGVALGFTNATRHTIGGIWKAVDGATSSVQFRKDGVNAQKITAATATGLFNSSLPIRIGAFSDGTTPVPCTVYGLKLYADGKLVASPDFTGMIAGQTSVRDAQGNVWTLAGAATVANPSASWVQLGLCNYSASWTAAPDVLSGQKPLVGTWTRLSHIAQMPDNLSGSGFLVVANGGFDIDLVMLEASADLNDYFAGDSQTGILGDFSWQGTTHQSLSFWYNNKYLVGARLFGTYTTGLVQKNGLVYDWVPAGTSIYTHWDVLSTNDTKQPLEDFASKVIP